MDLLTPSSPGGLPTLSLTTNSSWLPWGREACSDQLSHFQCYLIRQCLNCKQLYKQGACSAYQAMHWLSLRFNGHFSGGPWLADTRIFPYWILLELRTMEVVVTAGVINLAKLRSNCHYQKPTPTFFTGQMPFLSPNQQCWRTGGKFIIGRVIILTLIPKLTNWSSCLLSC